MKKLWTHEALSMQDSRFIKGLGILLIVFHNFFHHISPMPGENEFDFSILRLTHLWQELSANPLNIIDLSFSFLGHYGVQLFIFISGYGLMRAYGKRRIAWGAFMAKRLNKLYPTFILALIFYGIYSYWYEHQSIIVIEYLLRLTFLSNFIPGKIFALSGPWWFYGMIVELYAVFPLLLWVARRYPRYGLLVLSAIAYLVMLLWGDHFIDMQQNLHYHFLGNLPVFSLGIFLAGKDKISIPKVWIALAAVVFVAGNASAFFFWFTHLSIALLLVVGSLSWQGRIKAGSPLRRLLYFYGELSMYLFAVHGFLRPIFIDFAKEYHGYWLRPLVTLLSALAFLAFSTLIAWILKQLISIYGRIGQVVNKRWSEAKSSFLARLQLFTSRYYALFFSLLLVFSLMRIYEHLSLATLWLDQQSTYGFMLSVMPGDWAGAALFAALLLLPALVLLLVHPKLALWISFIGMLLTVEVQQALLMYYRYTGIPLGQVIFAYSPSAMWHLVQSSDASSWQNLWPLLAFPVLFIVFYLGLRPIKLPPFKTLLLLFGLLVLPFFSTLLQPDISRFKSEDRYYCAVNKSAYFVDALWQYRQQEKALPEHIPDNSAFQLQHPEHHYFSKDYPFFYWRGRAEQDKASPLSPFFKSGSKAPNVVLIMVESLSHTLSGADAGFSSFTPFLDSLAQHSLYWPHCLSSSERTFGVLPAILGSLPNGQKGFLDNDITHINYLDLISLLKKEGYYSRFFYGGWKGFNHMDHYLKQSNIDTIYTDFSPYPKIPENDKGFSWGYSDEALFRASFASLTDTTPYLSLYLTLSTHSPFKLNDTTRYYAEAQQIIKKAPEGPLKKMALKQYRALATFLYFDRCLHDFFRRYEKRKDYQNTLFIITGDHRTMLLKGENPLDAYRVPLLIYSPMLKRAKKFDAAVSHFDILPSLKSLLSYNYGLNFPAFGHEIGYLLDTTDKVNNRRFYPFIRNSRVSDQAWYRGHFYSAGKLYRVGPDMQLLEESQETLKDSIRQLLESYIKTGEYSLKNQRLIPTDYYYRVVKHKPLTMLQTGFEEDMLAYYSPDRSRDIAFEGRYSLDNGQKEYSSLFPDYTFKAALKELRYEIEFVFYSEELKEPMPLVVLSVERKGYDNIYWDGIDFNSRQPIQPGHWSKVRLSGSIWLQKKQKPGDKLKIYFWNRGKTHFYIDNLKASLFDKEDL